MVGPEKGDAGPARRTGADNELHKRFVNGITDSAAAREEKQDAVRAAGEETLAHLAKATGMPQAMVREMVQVEALQMEWQELLKKPDQDPSALARIDEIDRELAEIPPPPR